MTTADLAEYEAMLEEWRKDWRPGPWDQEPNREEFRHEGLPCIIQRGPSGAWCGYVGVPSGHPLHGVDIFAHQEEERAPLWDLSVHGGITYSERCAGSICHIPRPGESDDVWWLGFDCCHSGDVTPKESDPWPSSRYRTADYVRAETRSLAEQIAERSLTAGGEG